MCQTGAIISGSAALALLHPHQFVPNDINFYVLPPGFPAVLKYIEDYGYKIRPYDRALLNYFHQNIVVVRLVHPISHKSVNLMTGLDSHVVKFVTRFHSTLVMNYLSWFGLVVLYPEWTLNKRSLIVTDTLASQRCVMKYVDCGYALYHNVLELTELLEEHVCQVNLYCPILTHFLHNGHCFVEAFEPDGFNFEAQEHDMSWSLPVSCSFDRLDRDRFVE